MPASFQGVVAKTVESHIWVVSKMPKHTLVAWLWLSTALCSVELALEVVSVPISLASKH